MIFMYLKRKIEIMNTKLKNKGKNRKIKEVKRDIEYI